MNENMRREIKIGILLFAGCNVLRLFIIGAEKEIPALHFYLGGMQGLALVEIAVGLLPEHTYLRLKNFKKRQIPFIR